MKKLIRIAAVDFGPNTDLAERLLEFVSDRYEFELTQDTNVDYVFHSCMGYDVLKYSGVRIFLTGENISPNFNTSDYSLCFDKLNFGDRHYWLPLLRLYSDAYKKLRTPRRDPKEVQREKNGFCAYVMSNIKNSAPERTQIVDVLNTYKPVSLGGKWQNNVGGPVDNKIIFQSKYKFVIAFENSSTSGYLTEKFSEAAQSDAIPIYWGDPTVAETLNPKSFINCHDFDSFDAVLEQIKRIDQDDDLYRQILSEPWFPNGKEPEAFQQKDIVSFLCHISNQPHEQAYRRNRSRWGLKQENLLRRMYSQPLNHGVRRLRTKWLDFYHKIVPRKTHQG